jgi:predicted O-methyltransferase YrrM
MKIIRSILPYGIVTSKFDLKRFLRNLLPYGLAMAIRRKRRKDQFTAEFLKKNYVSDLTPAEQYTILSFLKYLEKQHEEVLYLEIGIYAGGTIKFLKERTNRVHFTGIDLFENFIPSWENTHIWRNYSIDQVREALGEKGVTLIKGDSVDVLQTLSGKKYHFIFIDGNHSYQATKLDFKYSVLLLEENGFIAFHNASPGLTHEDRHYIETDGGPWLLTQELGQEPGYRLIERTDRLKVFQVLQAYAT